MPPEVSSGVALSERCMIDWCRSQRCSGEISGAPQVAGLVQGLMVGGGDTGEGVSENVCILLSFIFQAFELFSYILTMPLYFLIV